MITKEKLVEILKTELVRISFQKVDGTERVMECTLKPDVVVPHKATTSRKKLLNEDVIPVWVLDIKEFRSFRFDSLKSYEIIKEL